MAAVADRLQRYAELAVRVGANVQQGQMVFVNSQLEHAPLARAITRAAYEAGARYVDVQYRDQHVRKAMIELGPDEALTHEPGWIKTLAEANAGEAQIATTGDPEPDLLSDLDVPVLTDFPAGHEMPNLTIPIGTDVELVAEESTGWITYREDALSGGEPSTDRVEQGERMPAIA